MTENVEFFRAPVKRHRAEIKFSRSDDSDCRPDDYLTIHPAASLGVNLTITRFDLTII